MGQVNVLCKLPSGLVLEVGYVLDYQLKKFVPTPAYKRAVLKGAMRAQIEQIRAINPGAQDLPAPENFTPSVTAVDEDLAREWFRLHAKDWAVRNGLIAIVEKPADLKPMVAEAEKQKTGFEPINTKGDPRTRGLDVEKADFKKTGWEQRQL